MIWYIKIFNIENTQIKPNHYERLSQLLFTKRRFYKGNVTLYMFYRKERNSNKKYVFSVLNKFYRKDVCSRGHLNPVSFFHKFFFMGL